MTWIMIKVEGYEELFRKLTPENLYAFPWKRALDDIRRETEQHTKQRAPLGKSGSIAPSITSLMDNAPIPLWAKIHMPDMPTRNGFRYPGALHGARPFMRLHGRGRGKMIQYKYSRGKFAGRPTKGWFTKSLGAARRLLQAKVKQLISEIQANWQR